MTEREGRLSENMTQPDMHHLIIVCCHAIYLGGPTNGFDENEWYVLLRDAFDGASFHILPGSCIHEFWIK